MIYALKSVGHIFHARTLLTSPPTLLLWIKGRREIRLRWCTRAKKQNKKGFVIRSTLNSFYLVRFSQPNAGVGPDFFSHSLNYGKDVNGTFLRLLIFYALV
jgi:hypothetical protein